MLLILRVVCSHLVSVCVCVSKMLTQAVLYPDETDNSIAICATVIMAGLEMKDTIDKKWRERNVMKGRNEKWQQK